MQVQCDCDLKKAFSHTMLWSLFDFSLGKEGAQLFLSPSVTAVAEQ